MDPLDCQKLLVKEIEENQKYGLYRMELRKLAEEMGLSVVIFGSAKEGKEERQWLE